MAKLSRLEISGYRSIQGPLTVTLPARRPLVLLGENNAGKSNIVSAFDLVLGQRWTGNHDPEDHEFYGRNRNEGIEITAKFDPDDLLADQFFEARWSHNVDQANATELQVAPGYGQHRYRRMTNAAKDDCTCVVIGADRNLDYELSYKSSYTFLSRLMHHFHKALTEEGEVREQLEGLFEEVRGRFEQIQPFADFTAELQEQLGGFGGSMTHRLEVDFQAYNPVNFFHALRLHAREGDSVRTLDELGTGEQQILALSFAYAFASAFTEGLVLVIEEPEAHLHPLAQQWLARRIGDMSRDGLQVVLTTHSPHFIDVENLEGIALVRKDARGTHAVQLTREQLATHCVETGVPEHRVSADNVLEFYSSVTTAEILEGFFAKVVVLVEGPTESFALPFFLERFDVLPNRDGVAVVPVGGKGNLAKWRRLFSAYQIPTYVVFDNDGRRDDEDGVKRRDALASMGVPEEQRETVLTAAEWIVAENYMVFPENFEVTMRNEVPGYADLEDQAIESGVETKPFKARYVAQRIEHGEGNGWGRLQDFAERVRALVPAAPVAAGAGGRPADGGEGRVARPAHRPR